MDQDIKLQIGRVIGGAAAAEVESYTLDFKEVSNSSNTTEKLLVDAAICFANAEGGTIVIGVDDDAVGVEALVGTDLDVQTVQRRIYELTRPALLVKAEEIWIEGSRLVILTVPRSFEIHADTQGRAKRRVGTDCLPMSPQDQAALREERRGVDWSAELAGSSITDLVPAALDAPRRRLRQGSDQMSELAKLSDLEMLRGLGVVDEQDRPLRAGEVLFCNPADGSPWIVYQHRSTPAVKPRPSSDSAVRYSSRATNSSNLRGHGGM